MSHDSRPSTRLNETTRDHKEQVRKLLKYERNFQRIAAEAGGSDALEDPRTLLAADAQSLAQAQANANETPLLDSTSRHLRTVLPIFDSSILYLWRSLNKH
ncbi:hypothetical protein BC826DRAFT_1191324 [Russula brevipes]|nr:hypothetical protein BC826DRAFT_1191324 [Russula brevipes]